MENQKKLLSQRLDQRRSVWQNLEIPETLLQFISVLCDRLHQGAHLFIIGNGGSACESSHLAAELVNRLYRNRRACAALALSTDTANLTAIANDSDYRYIFSRQLEALARPGDMLLALTTGGESPNILEALTRGRELGLHTSVLCGQKLTKLQAAGPDILIPVVSPDTPTIQEIHLFFVHLIAEAVEQTLHPQP